MNLSQIFWRHLFGDERHHRSFILTIYAIFSKYRHYKYFWNNYHIGVGQIFRSGPGGTITASTTATYTVGVTSNVSASITTGQIVKASISAGFSNSTSSSRSTSYKYSRSISPGRYGEHAVWQLRCPGKRKKATIVAPCNVQVLASGSAIVPSANVWGYRYWES